MRGVEVDRAIVAGRGPASGRDLATGCGDLLGPRGVVVIGFGSEDAGDDAVGLEVVRRLRYAGAAEIAVQEFFGDLTALLDIWRGFRAAVLVDAMRSGVPPGSVRRVEVGHDSLPSGLGIYSSTHAIGLADAIALADALDQMPAHVVLYAVEGRRFQTGAQMSRQVSAVVPRVADAVLSEASRLARARRAA